MKKTLILVCLLFLQACTTPLKPSVSIPKEDPLVVLSCPDLVPLEEGQEVTMGDMLLKIVEISNQYYLCKASAENKIE
jgi:hypothetical protein